MRISKCMIKYGLTRNKIVHAINSGYVSCSRNCSNGHVDIDESSLIAYLNPTELTLPIIAQRHGISYMTLRRYLKLGFIPNKINASGHYTLNESDMIRIVALVESRRTSVKSKKLKFEYDNFGNRI